MKLKDKTYDVLKWVTMICIPALGGAYAALAPVWGWPLADEICRSANILTALLGTLLGISTAEYNKEQKSL